MPAPLTFVLGGARSGKSRYAESLIVAMPPPWAYIATAQAGDAEMATRIGAHRARRGPQWRTLEVPRDLPAALKSCGKRPALIDCLTLWLSNLMAADADIDAEIERLDGALAAARAPVVLVSNEVGYGIVPENPLGRRFRDLQGTVNQRIAARVDCAVLVVAGLPLLIKGTVPVTS